MKKNRFFSFLICLGLLLGLLSPAALAEDAPEVGAKAVIVLDLTTGEVLYEKNADERRSPASLTKIMTGLLAAEAAEQGLVGLDEAVTAGLDCQQGLDSDSSNASIVAGETMSFKDYYYCAMVKSANDACNVLAGRVSGSIGAFVERMNERAAELGCTGTHFSDTNGLSNENHYSTARDLSLMLREALRHETFAEAFSAAYYEIGPTNVNPAREMYSSNALITTRGFYGDGYLYEPAIGAKTGYTRQAGYCLASTAEKDGLQLMVVVLGCEGYYTGSDVYYNFRDTITLYEWAFRNFSYRQVLSANDAVTRAEIRDADGDGVVILRPESDVVLLLPNDVDPASRELDVTLNEEALVAPIPAGAELGSAMIRINGKSYGPIRLVTSVEVKRDKAEILRDGAEAFVQRQWVRVAVIVIAGILVIYFILVLRYRALRKKHLREKRRAEQRRRAAQAQRRKAPPVVSEPTQRFSSVDPGERSPEPIDLGRFFDGQDKND